MKFFVLLAFCVVFLTVFTRADDESEEEESEEESEEDSEDAQALSSAMQLNGNNVGDINNIKVNWNGELHNNMQTDIYSVILAIMNRQKIIEHGGDDSEEDDDDEDDE